MRELAVKSLCDTGYTFAILVNIVRVVWRSRGTWSLKKPLFENSEQEKGIRDYTPTAKIFLRKGFHISTHF